MSTGRGVSNYMELRLATVWELAVCRWHQVRVDARPRLLDG